ncbi:hypothetical protein RJT34_20566 [Clitoria ternatea]|uniref:Uncharacterized protein n=1 Tax=Clitoria ternatea TaxID=43366 RepID=A0AAN9P537_CLITE
MAYDNTFLMCQFWIGAATLCVNSQYNDPSYVDIPVRVRESQQQPNPSFPPLLSSFHNQPFQQSKFLFLFFNSNLNYPLHLSFSLSSLCFLKTLQQPCDLRRRFDQLL